MATINAAAVYPQPEGQWETITHHYLLQGTVGLPDAKTFAGGTSLFNLVPTTVSPLGITATKLDDFFDLFYNRIAVIPDLIDAGSVSSAQTFQVEVWNGFFQNKQLTAINEVDAEGILVQTGLPISSVFLQLQSSVYDIVVDTDGPPTIDAFLSWVFGTDLGTLNIVGSRLSVFGFEPDTKLTESLRWLTDVFRTFSSEQRVRLRKNARQVFEFVTQADGEIQTRLNNIMYGWQDKVFALPYWPDAVKHVNPIVNGATEILIDTVNRDFRDGELAIIWADDLANEAFEIDTVDSDRLNLTREVVNDYPDGALIIPIVKCLSEGGLRRQIGRMDDTRSTITFRGQDNISIDDQTQTWNVYDGYELWEGANFQFGSINSDIVLPVKFLDNQTGYFRNYPTRSITDETGLQSFVVRNAADRLTLKKYLFRRLGRLKPFWLESYRRDFVPVQTIGAGAITMTIQHTNQRFSQIAEMGFALKFILQDGSIFYRGFNGLVSEDIANQTEIVEFSSNLGQEVLPEDIDRISILRLTRFDTDNLALDHYIGEGIITTLSVPTITIKYPEV
jgi:hypothetical protein